MASYHLSNTIANFNQTDSKLPAMTVSAGTSITSTTTTPFKLNSSKLCSTGLQHLPQGQSQIINHIENSQEPSTPASSSSSSQQFPLRIGIVGLGAFGQFLAKAFQRQGHHVLGTSRSDYSDYCQEQGIIFFRDLNGLCEAQPDILLVCSSILSTEDIVRGIPFHKLKSNTIVADVLSVKEFPKKLFLDVVPKNFGILCTHPMFGKYSGKNSWEGLRFVYDKVRIAENSIQQRKCEQFLNIFQDQLEKLEKAFDEVKQNLFGKLRGTLRRQIEETVPVQKKTELFPSTRFLPSNEKVILKDLSSFSMVPDQRNLLDVSVEPKNEVYHMV
ncbi:hypothetical protein IFM89_018762 [Coptis chinensis]|uniref:Prephenate/arogenate dehydrogenase domain-containing protein n=1 Tax=Coptis chinensis TaxID=261450 RepID=A0A835HKU0_9MAGN|nr:hypothetical protein IFM89_018762 [Coptis chinensis]